MEPKNINFAAMPRTAISVITGPAEFFRGMSRTGGFLEPFVFAVIMGLIAGIIQVILGFIGLGQPGGYGLGMTGSFDVLVIMPVAFAVVSFIVAAVLFIIWKLMGSPENYETAYRCTAFLTVLSPFTGMIGAIPYAGILINSIIYLFFLVTASIHIHNIPPRKAWLVFGIMIAILAILLVRGEYKIRSMAASMHPWRQMGEDYRKKAKDMERSSEEIRRQAAEMAKPFQEQAEEAKKQAR